MNIDNSNNNRLLLDLRNGIGYALTRLSLLSSEVDHLILRQSTPLFAGLRVDQDDLVDIFQAISLLQLSSVCIADFDKHATALPASCLTHLLTHCHGLTLLKLDSIRMAGSRRDFQDLALALQHHPALEEIVFSGCVPVPEESTTLSSTSSNRMQHLAIGMAQSPTLKLVEIVETTFPPSGAWTGESLAQLCTNHHSLQVLRVRGVRFLGDQDLALMASTLKHNSTLKELWILSCELGFTGVGPAAIADMLRVNTSLEILGLNRLSFNDHAIAIAEALQGNRSLKGLHLCLRDGLTSRIYGSYAKLMEQNYVLETMSGGFMSSKAAVGGRSERNKTQIDFYLKLNKHGRRFLLQDENLTQKHWLDALSSQNDDLSALFYLLSRNPSLCIMSTR